MNHKEELKKALKGITDLKQKEKVFLEKISPIITERVGALYLTMGWAGSTHWIDNNLKWIFTDVNGDMEDYHSEFHSRSTDIVEVMQETNNELIGEFLR